jgi:hypothetical protein
VGEQYVSSLLLAVQERVRRISMWHSGWKRHHLPYRGEPKPKYPKRRRQLRNLKAERRQIAITLLVIFILTAFVLSLVLLSSVDESRNKFAASIVVLVVASILTIAILSGITSVNKFRKGYDVDISDEREKEKDQQSKDSNDY